MNIQDLLRGGLRAAGIVANPISSGISSAAGYLSDPARWRSAARATRDTVLSPDWAGRQLDSTLPGRFVRKAADLTIGAGFRDIARDTYRFTPESISQEADSTGRTFWSVFRDRFDTNKNFRILQSQMRYIQQGASPTQAREMAISNYTANPTQDSELIGNIATIPQGTARSGGHAAISISNLVSRGGGTELTAEEAEKRYGIPQDLFEGVFGKDKKLKSLGSLREEGNQMLQEQFPGLPPGLSNSMAGIGVGAYIVSEFTGTGAGKKGAVKIADELIPQVSDAIRLSRNLTKEKDYLNAAKALGFKDKGALRAQQFMEKVVDFTAPIERQIIRAKKAGVDVSSAAYDIMYRIGNSLRANTLAASKLTEMGFPKLVKDIENSGYSMEDFSNYVVAKHVGSVESKFPGKTGLDPARVADYKKMEGMSHIFEPYRQQFVKMNQQMLDYAVEKGLVDTELATKLKEVYPEYVPMQRVFTLLEQEGQNAFGSRGVGGLSTQSVIQKMEGSERLVEDPVKAFMNKVRDTVVQGEKNVAGQTLSNFHDLGEADPFKLVPIKTAAQVKERQRLLEQLKEAGMENRETRKALAGSNKTYKEINDKIAATEAEYDELFEEAATRAADFDNQSAIDDVLSRATTREKRLSTLYAKKDLKEEELAELRLLADEGVADVKAMRQALKGTEAAQKNLERDTFSFYRDGIKETWEADKDIVAALKNLNEETLNPALRAVRGGVRVLKLGATGLNFPFAMANIVRDFMTGILNRPFKEDPLTFVRTTASALRTAGLHGVKNPITGKALSKTADEQFDELLRWGAGGTSFDITRENVGASFDLMKARANWRNRLEYFKKHPVEEFKNFIRFAEDTIGRSEEFGRLVNFYGSKQAFMKAGFSEEDATRKAVMAARETTADFYRRGSWGNWMNAFFPYFNAGIQGTRATVRAAKFNPERFAAKFATTIMIPYTVSMTNNLSTPEKREAWDNIPEWEKRTNIIWIREDGSYYKLPLVPNVGSAVSAIRHMFEGFRKDDPKAIVDIAQNLAGTFAPIDLSMQGIMSMGVTQLAKPWLETQSNYNIFTDQPIIPPDLQGLLPEDQYQQGKTSFAARLIGRATDSAPMNVQHLIEGYFGGTGRAVTHWIDTALQIGGIIDGEQVGGRGILEDTARRFYRSEPGTASEQEMHDTITKYQQESKSLNKRMNDRARVLLEGLRTVDPARRKELLLDAEQEYPGISKKLVDLVEQDSQGLTTAEKRIKNLGVTNGVRAAYIKARLIELPASQRRAYMLKLAKKRILTEEVTRQVMTLIVNDRLPEE